MKNYFSSHLAISLTFLIFASSQFIPHSEKTGIWISRPEILALPMSGTAWENVKSAADKSVDSPNLGSRNQKNDVHTLAKALVYVRTGEAGYRTEVIEACMAIIGTEDKGDALALGRNLPGYVIAADLVGLPPEQERKFRDFLSTIVTKQVDRGSLQEIHERRPNNWGTHAGAARAAVAAWLGDENELARTAKVLKGWMGDSSSYASFKYGELWWQAASTRQVGINPAGATKDGHSIDGVLPDDQRRGGQFKWPPPKENYVYEALQGVLVQAVILSRAGYDVWRWENDALLRAFKWLHEEANFPAEGDDTWQPHLINYFYGTDFPAPKPSSSGKNVGWTDWTHSGRDSSAGKNGSITGSILDASNNAAVAEATLQLQKTGVIYRQSLSEADGRFSLTDIVAGEYKIVVWKAGFDSANAAISLQEGENIIDLRIYLHQKQQIPPDKTPPAPPQNVQVSRVRTSSKQR